MAENKTIKFFISSTFKDFEQERDVLHKFVFPKLKILCHESGFGFQPIDLRWGVMEEAGVDQQTMNICLNEINRSSYDPKPNLLLLVGQRYGWVPLPYDIEENEYDAITENIPIEDKNLIDDWYKLDKNSNPRTYFLQEKSKYKNDRDAWTKIEDQIKLAFQKSTDLPRYHTSATEQEMAEGLDAFSKEVEHKHTFAYFRTIKDYEHADEKIIADFIDKDMLKFNELSKRLQEKINIPKVNELSERLQEKTNIPNENQIVPDDVKWDDISKAIETKYITLDLEKCPTYLKDFHDEILEKFEKSIQTEIDRVQENSITDLQIELEEQKKFLELKSEIVIGRGVETIRITDFIESEKSQSQYYLQYGKSGSGKTSVMAQAIQEIDKDKYEVIYRFIGTTALSTYSRVVFESIYWEIETKLQNKKNIIKPTFEHDDQKFKDQFQKQLKTLQDKQVVIFLDALDQFEDYNALTILLEGLPQNIKIVFSTLYDKEKDTEDYYRYYNRVQYLDNKHKLEPLNQTDNLTILEAWLGAKGRTLTKAQCAEIKELTLGKTPLYLKLVFEMVKHFTVDGEVSTLAKNEEGLIVQFFNFIQTQYHHEESLMKNTLGLISASKDGLSEEELLDLFSRDEKFLQQFQNKRYQQLDRLPTAIWSRFYYYIEEFFTEKLIDGEMLITPFHRIISETIKKEYYQDKAEKLHQDLADYFITLQDREKVWDERYNNLHMLSETPYQLFYSNNSKGLKEILFDIEFSGSIYDHYKQVGFREIMEKATELEGIIEDEIYPWESFYREKEHLITNVDEKLWRPHQSLFQLTYEDGDNSPLSQKAENILNVQKLDFIWLKRKNRDKNFIRSGLQKILVQNNIVKLDIINNDTIVCMTNEVIYFFDMKGNILNKIVAKKYEKYIDHEDLNYKINQNSLVYVWFSGIKETNFKLSCFNNKGHLVFNSMEHTSCIKKILFLSDTIITWTEENKIHIWENNLLKLTIEDDKDCITYRNKLICSGIRKLKKINEERFLSISNAYEFIKVWSYNGEVIFRLDGFIATDVLILPTGEFLGWSTKKTEMIIWKNNGEILKKFNKKIKIDCIQNVYVEMNYIISISEEDVKIYWTFDGTLIKTEKLKRQTDEYGYLESEKSQKMKIGNVNIDWSNGLKFVEKNYIENKDKKSDYLLISSIIYKKNNCPKSLIRFDTEDLSIRWNENDNILISHRNNITLNIKSNQIELLGHRSTVKGILVHKGKFITFDEYGKIIIWSLKGEKILENTAHSSWVNGAIVINDEKFLTYGIDGKVIIWNFNGTKEFKFIAHEGCISYLELLNDDTIITYSNSCYHKSDYQINIFNTKGKLKHKSVFPNNLCTSSLILE